MCQSANGAVPASGRLPLSTLEQVVANFNVDPSSGTLTQTDYFEPYEYSSLNGADRDFGSSGSALLDPGTFSGGGIDRIIVAGGKSGKVYILNADNLGGYAQGMLSLQALFPGEELTYHRRRRIRQRFVISVCPR